VEAVRSEARDGLASYLRELLLLVFLCALTAGLIVALAVRSRSVPRLRWLFGAALGTALAGCLALVLLLPPRGVIADPEYYANGPDIPVALRTIEQAQGSARAISEELNEQLVGLARLVSESSARRQGQASGFVLASDLHNNLLALPALDRAVGSRPLFFAGDLTSSGSPFEFTLVRRIVRLGHPFVFVSGNHDSDTLERALARRGVTVLTRDGIVRPDGTHGAPMTEVAGLRVAGFDDPLEWRSPNPGDPRRIFSFSELPDPEQATTAAQRDLVRWFDGLPRRPDVVLVHQNGLAQFLARTLFERGVTKPLAILTGHDHRQHVTSYGAITVVDAGTAGASGIYGVGRDEVGLGDLRFSPQDRVLQAADVIAVEPVSGAAQAQRVLTTGACPQPDARVCRRFPEPDEEEQRPQQPPSG